MTISMRLVRPWMLYAATGGFILFEFWRAATGRLGVEPIDTLLRSYGAMGFYLLLVGLAVSPLRRRITLLHLRRALGLCAFFLLSAHLAVFAVLDLGSLRRLGAEIAERPYITLGMAGFALLIPLALTSTDRMIRKLGPRWRSLHRLVYPAAILGWLHYDLQIRGFDFKSLLLGAILAGLLGFRLLARRKTR